MKTTLHTNAARDLATQINFIFYLAVIIINGTLHRHPGRTVPMNVTPKTIGRLRTCDQKNYAISIRHIAPTCREFVAVSPPSRNFAKGWGTQTRAVQRFFVCDYIAIDFED